MSIRDILKEMNINIHVVSTGVGPTLQQTLWDRPGSSAYLSGGSFPYSEEEQEELLGFMPEHFCSEEAVIDLASVAYMKSYKFGGKDPVGVGITGSVASEKEHRGDHRVHTCVITNDKVYSAQITLEKGIGEDARQKDNVQAARLAWYNFLETVMPFEQITSSVSKDTTSLALERFMAHPFFSANGKRLSSMPEGRYALMPGAYNPPHEGHFGLAQSALDNFNYKTVFEITATSPHKGNLTVQQLLQRAKLLQGHDRLFTQHLSLYLDKARAFPGKPIIIGADAMQRILDPKWGVNIKDALEEFKQLHTIFLVCGREIDGKFTTCNDVLKSLTKDITLWSHVATTFIPLEGRWDISSTQLRDKLV